VALVAGCGAPPEPLPTSPPEPVGSAGLPSGGLGPSGPLPSPGATYPGVVPTTPGLPLPTIPVVPTTTSPSPTPPPPAPVCTSGPSKQQVLDVVKGKPGIPEDALEVRLGPYCASTWQFAILGIVGQDEDSVDPLLVITTGRPSSLKLLEAGADVCTDKVEDDAPPGIRVRACGS
jgi:hypothetical protein